MSIDTEIGKAVRHLRELLGVDHLLQMDMIRVLNEMKKRGLIADWVVVPDSEMPKIDGHWKPEARAIYLPERTRTGAERGVPRANFSIAHEVAHVIDGVTEARNRGSVRGRRTARDEYFADRFAAEFLAPSHKANFTLQTTEDEVRQRFNLSAAAAKKRHAELAREFRRANQIERPLPAVVIDFLKEAQARGKEVRSLPPLKSQNIPSISANPAPREVATVAEACSACGWPRIELDGTARAHCPKCGAVYDRFQDGDTVAS